MLIKCIELLKVLFVACLSVSFSVEMTLSVGCVKISIKM